MVLILPDVSVTIGPAYATQNNSAFTLVDSHDHTAGKGVLIPTAGININADLEFNSNAALELQKVGFDNLGALLTGNRFLQVFGGEIYFNDGSGNQVQITSGGSLDITSSGGIGGDYTSAGASLIYTDASRTYTFRDGVPNEALIMCEGIINNGKYEWSTVSPAGNLTIVDTDVNFIVLVDTTAARTITLPDPTLGERVVIIKDRTGTANINNITIARNGAENIENVAASFVYSTPFGSLQLVSDLTNWWIINEWRGEERRLHSARIPIAAVGTISVATQLNLLAATDVHGTYIVVNNVANDITFNKAGIYKVTGVFGQLDSTAGTRTLNFIVRDSGATIIDSQIIDIDTSTDSATYSFNVEITDITDTYELVMTPSGAIQFEGSNDQVIIDYLGET